MMPKIEIGLKRHLLLNTGCLIVILCFSISAAIAAPLTMKETIQKAVSANLEIMQAADRTKAAKAVRNAQISKFLPKFNATYQYTHYDEELRSPDFVLPAPLNITIPGSVQRPQDQFAFVGTATQPIFTGFALVNQYKLAKLGLDAAEINQKLARLNVIFGAKHAYYSVLKAQKLMAISEEAVQLLEAHKGIADNFYQVGMVPRNDVLKAEVELANAKQDLVVAQNALELAKSNFNLVLRRAVNSPVAIEDVTDYTPLERDIDFYLETAKANRLELKISDLEVQMAKKEVSLAWAAYAPTISVKATYAQLGTEGNLQGGEGIADDRYWNVMAVASWDIWEWGESYFGVKEKLHLLSQVRHKREDIQDRINLEIREAYLKAKESEKNITTVETAIEQAKENLRIEQERYREQVATSTDVMDAQTLLSKTMTNYFSALYDFKISRASLEKAISLEVTE